MTINWPAEINYASFLQKYWQKKPLLVRNAFTHPPEIISPEELAGMAMESEIESRIISNYPEASKWHLLHGPFEEDVLLNYQ